MLFLTCFASLLLWTCLCVPAASYECPYKDCVCNDGAEIVCKDVGWTTIPIITGSSIGWTFLSLEANRITTVPAKRLPSNLTEIIFSDNPITIIEDAAFDDCKDTLETLTFSGAQFTRIPDAFSHLRVLRSLSIYDTWIQDWNMDIMTNIGSSLVALVLVNVSLHTWPTWMQHFSHLTALNLETNYISVIPDSALDLLANILISLDISKNNLTAVPKTVSIQKVIRSLDLGYNRISDLTWLPQSTELSDLSLMYNNITDARHISNMLRPLANVLSNVALFGNQLSEIPDFSFMENIGYLDLSHNHMSDINSGALSDEVTTVSLDFNSFPAIPRIFTHLNHVDTISLSYNFVTEIHGTDIPVWIEEVDIGYNLITQLSDTSFPENSQINTLTLMSNPIVQISKTAFQNLQHLTILNLQNTKLTRLPLALGDLNKLNWLDITGSQYLVCTCMEKMLEPWILHFESPMQGDCGVTSIFNFFTTFVSDCP